MKKLILAAFLLVCVSTSYAQEQSFQTRELTVDVKGINGKFYKSTSKTNIIIAVEDERVIIALDGKTLSIWKILNRQITGTDIAYLLRNMTDSSNIQALILSKNEIHFVGDQMTVTYSFK